MIYDTFLFFNELDLLRIRLETLKDHVDKFVLVESTTTFSGLKKPLYYNENKHLFKDFEERIIHVIVDDTPTEYSNIQLNQNPKNEMDVINNHILINVMDSTGWDKNNPNEWVWGNETYQRECIYRGLIGVKPEDLIFVSDCDEIPNPMWFQNDQIIDDNVMDFKQDMYCYYLNVLKETNWSGTKACLNKTLIKFGINKIRQNKHTNQINTRGGWHFSFLGGAERVKLKIEAYSYQEYNTAYYKNKIQENDPFMRGKLVQIAIDSTYPIYIQNNRNKVNHLIK